MEGLLTISDDLFHVNKSIENRHKNGNDEQAKKPIVNERIDGKRLKHLRPGLFDEAKRRVTESDIDLSRKGSIDILIRPLCEVINNSPDYFTTSSCSGRVILFRKTNSGQKQNTEWLFTSHTPIDAGALIDAIKSSPTDTRWLKFEPFVLHVRCRDVAAASAMLNAATNAGCRDSGVTPSTKGAMLALRCCNRLEIPLPTDIPLPDNYLKFIAETVNDKFDVNNQLIARITGCITTFLSNK